MEIVNFVNIEEIKDQVDSLFGDQKKMLNGVISNAEIEHIGSTSIPGSLTKGDLDINVRVEEKDFKTTIESLRELYDINQPDNWTDTFASFKDDNSFTLPFGIQLTVKGGPEDNFVRQKEVLISHLDLNNEYNALKKLFEGKEMDVYRKAKSEFFNKVKQVLTPSNQ